MTAPRVLVLGGTGVFGARLVRGLAARTDFGVVVAARDGTRTAALAEELRAAHPGRDITALALDATTASTKELRAIGAFAVVDAAGPWQGSSHRLPRAALAAGLHWLDLSDARDHLAGFASALDAEALAAGLVALCGASSTPALSNAALDEVLRGWRAVETIEVAISPGNRAPRGRAVVRAILSYAGRPVRVFRDGAWGEAPGWGLTRRLVLPGAGWRWLSLCETPDLDILAARFAPRRAALFRAGLELGVLHLGLAAASLAVRAGLLRSLAPFAGLAHAVATMFGRFGSDRGAMLVQARGLDAEGRATEARWWLLAEAGDGPLVPTLPALAALRLLAAGRLAPGARPCVGVLPLDTIMAEGAGHRITTGLDVTRPATLFRRALGDAAFAALPAPLRRLHSPGWRLAARGEAAVQGATGLLPRLAARLIGFPRDATAVPVRVEMLADGHGETWRRDFGGRRFASHLSPAVRPGAVIERFGPLSFELDLPSDGAGMRLVVRRWWAFGLPMPPWLAPVGDASEGVDEAGRFRFDVEIRLPVGLGRVVRYRGWLVPEAELTPGS